jgi:putative intracellular protease/amidase
MEKFKVLMIATSHSKLGNTNEQTGVWLEELAAPYYTFTDAGAIVTIASPKGGIVPLDPKSELAEWQTEFTKRFMADDEAVYSLQNAQVLATVNADDFDLLFFPGGHGPMWDLGYNADAAKIIRAFNADEKPIGLVCHGVVALLGAIDASGKSIAAGKRLTSFSNREEAAVGLTDVVPFLLEESLKNEGAIYRKGTDFESFIIEDGNLVTGQNPASSLAAAQKAIELIKATI